MAQNLNVTGIWLPFFMLLYLFLALRVVKVRRKELIGLGTGESKVLLKAVRVHGNFSEYIPLLALAIITLELRGLETWALHLIFATAFLARVLVLQGLTKSSGVSWQRFIGNGLTFLLYLTCSMIHLVISLN